MPSFALLILSYRELPNRPDLTTGTAYVIVLGVNTIDFLPATVAVFLSPLVNSKSPCKIPEMPRDGKYFKQTFNFTFKS